MLCSRANFQANCGGCHLCGTHRQAELLATSKTGHKSKKAGASLLSKHKAHHKAHSKAHHKINKVAHEKASVLMPHVLRQ